MAQLFFPDKAHGSLISDRDGTVRGSALLGQDFTSPTRFHPRPSAAGTGHDAANSGGSNLGPTSQTLRDLLRERIVTYRARNRLPADAEVPADAVTASGSGLDPHISIRNASLQAQRVADARQIPIARVRRLIETHTESPALRVLGEPGVNVLKLNLALDALP
jgi:K+-transporting ATPase ATPase C chain